jgi:hypothetical protein
MRRRTELEDRLREWAEEYRYTAPDNHGWQGKSPTAVIAKWGGRPPEGLGQETPCSAADEVERAVMALEKTKDGYRAARVLRCEYWMVNAAEAHKLQRLRAMGCSMSRTTYYDELWVARIHVAAWLRIAASPVVDMAS